MFFAISQGKVMDWSGNFDWRIGYEPYCIDNYRFHANLHNAVNSAMLFMEIAITCENYITLAAFSCSKVFTVLLL